ncbi:hypothetical protein [Mesorhizobium australicum]|uniref:hypothetical protein n=1 Tax=Mesorhizobium australicum TaxID=536018 RepID=UPI000A1C8C17|nr:hypothetical protein [Mesorhizobium australicum]
MAFAPGPSGLAEPKVVSLVDRTDAAAPTRAELFELGFSVVLYAVTMLLAAWIAIELARAQLSDIGRAEALAGQMSYAKFSGTVDFARFQVFARDHETW